MKLSFPALGASAICRGMARPLIGMSILAYRLAGGPMRHIKGA